MIFNTHTQSIDIESQNIISYFCKHPKNRSTFALAFGCSKPPTATYQDIFPTLMITGNSLIFFGRNGLPNLVCCFLFVLWLPLQAQTLKQEDPLAPLYKNKGVKTITAWQAGAQPDEKIKTYYREYNANGQLIFELVYGENGAIVKKYQSFYSTDNRLVKEVWTLDDTDSVTYKYKNGKLTEESWHWGADKSRTRVVHFFDSLDRKTCTVSKNSWGVYVDSFFYENGRIAQTKNYNENGLLTSMTEHIYDSKGRLTKTVLEDEHGNVIQTTNTLYWETGPVKSSETILFSAANKNTTAPVAASMAENYKYDTQKQLKEININSYTNNELLVNTKITYIYNDKGLPLSQSTHNVVTNTKQLLRFAYTFF